MNDEPSGSSPPSDLGAHSDWSLLEEWKTGNRRAATVLIQRYSGALARFFRNKVRDPEDANELVSEALMGCIKAFDRIESRDSFRPFMFGVAMNVLREYLRRKYKRQREFEDFDDVCVGDDDDGSPSRIIARQSEARLLVRALRRIPLKYQIVLEMQFFEEMTGPQIAELLQMPVSTVYTYQNRGRERLQAKLTELAEDPALAQSTMMGIQTWAEDIRAQIEPPGASGSGQ